MEVENTNEHEDELNEDALWSIEDDTLFHPCGLISHSSSSNNKTKSVFVTWNEFYLLNYRFKKSKKTKRMEMTKVRIPLPKNSCLRSIHMLEYNTLLLMSDGRVHCFGSIKSLHIISWLKGVRAFARTPEGFSVVRHNEETQQLLLQVYVDLPSLGKGESTLQHSYDITHDEQNIFQCDWQNDPYTLLTFSITQQHEKFMQCLFGSAASTDKQIHIFSIAGHLFALIPLDGDAAQQLEQDYHIELLCVYATSVNFLRLLPEQNLCLVFLSCGSVDIWYMSQLLGIKQRQMYYTGAEWLDYDVSSNNGDFYYTDGEQLVRLRFQYDGHLDDCQVQRCIKPVPGMQACTWVQHIEQLVCLSDNNIFYRISFSLEQLDLAADKGELADLSPMTIDRLRSNALVVKQYEQQPMQLLAAIQREHEKQQLIAVARNEAWLDCDLKATLQFHRQLPTFGPDVLLLHTERQVKLDSSGVYALFQLHLSNSQHLLHSSHWQIHVYQGHQAHVHRLPTELLLSRNCRIVIPLKKVPNERLPNFSLNLIAFLEVNNQISAVVLPITLEENNCTYRALFSPLLQALNLYNKPQLVDLLNKTRTNIANTKTQQKLITPNGLNLVKIAEICNANGRAVNNLLELYFMDSKVSISINEEEKSVLVLESADISALYYLKQQLFLNVNLDDEPPVLDEIAKIKVMKLQHEVERFYGTQYAEEFETNPQIHLESLELKYKTLRNTVF